MDQLADLHITLDRIEEANELLMPMALHAATETLPSSTSSAANKVVVPWRL